MAPPLPTEGRVVPRSHPVATVDNSIIGTTQPTMAFYTQMPKEAECIFSLNDKIKTKRFLKHILPKREVEPQAWNTELVKTKAAEIRSKCPDAAKSVARPEKWEDLYCHFDASDLWHEGAWNLWRVIEQLFEENLAQAVKDYDSDKVDEISDWVYGWLTWEENRQKLLSWDIKSDILDIFSPKDRDEVKDCDPAALEHVRGALTYWHGEYVPSPQHVQPQITTSEHDNPKSASLAPPVELHPRCSSANSLSYLPVEPGPSAGSVSMSATPVTSGFSSIIFDKHDDLAPTNVGNKDRPLKSAAEQGVTANPAAKGRHHPSKSGPIPTDFDSRDIRNTVDMTGPSRLPRNVPQQIQPDVAEAPKGTPQKPGPSRRQTPTAPATKPQHVPVHHNSGPAQGRHHSTSQPRGPRAAKPDTTYSNGWVATRVDNIHGPVMQHRHNARRGSPSAASDQRSGTSPAGCKNAGIRDRTATRYVPCDCPRCEPCSRSVRAMFGLGNPTCNLSPPEMTEIITNFFSQWGKVEHLKWIPNGVIVPFTAEASALEAFKRANLHPLPPFTVALRTSFPYYSKHYRPPKGYSNTSPNSDIQQSSGQDRRSSAGSPYSKQSLPRPGNPGVSGQAVQHQKPAASKITGKVSRLSSSGPSLGGSYPHQQRPHTRQNSRFASTNTPHANNMVHPHLQHQVAHQSSFPTVYHHVPFMPGSMPGSSIAGNQYVHRGFPMPFLPGPHQFQNTGYAAPQQHQWHPMGLPLMNGHGQSLSPVGFYPMQAHQQAMAPQGQAAQHVNSMAPWGLPHFPTQQNEIAWQRDRSGSSRTISGGFVYGAKQPENPVVRPPSAIPEDTSMGKATKLPVAHVQGVPSIQSHTGTEYPAHTVSAPESQPTADEDNGTVIRRKPRVQLPLEWMTEGSPSGSATTGISMLVLPESAVVNQPGLTLTPSSFKDNEPAQEEQKKSKKNKPKNKKKKKPVQASDSEASTPTPIIVVRYNTVPIQGVQDDGTQSSEPTGQHAGSNLVPKPEDNKKSKNDNIPNADKLTLANVDNSVEEVQSHKKGKSKEIKPEHEHLVPTVNELSRLDVVGGAEFPNQSVASGSEQAQLQPWVEHIYRKDAGGSLRIRPNRSKRPHVRSLYPDADKVAESKSEATASNVAPVATEAPVVVEPSAISVVQKETEPQPVGHCEEPETAKDDKNHQQSALSQESKENPQPPASLEEIQAVQQDNKPHQSTSSEQVTAPQEAASEDLVKHQQVASSEKGKQVTSPEEPKQVAPDEESKKPEQEASTTEVPRKKNLVVLRPGFPPGFDPYPRPPVAPPVVPSAKKPPAKQPAPKKASPEGDRIVQHALETPQVKHANSQLPSAPSKPSLEDDCIVQQTLEIPQDKHASNQLPSACSAHASEYFSAQSRCSSSELSTQSEDLKFATPDQGASPQCQDSNLSQTTAKDLVPVTDQMRTPLSATMSVSDAAASSNITDPELTPRPLPQPKTEAGHEPIPTHKKKTKKGSRKNKKKNQAAQPAAQQVEE
ncbi:hypothetical protein B0H66DRAFT_612306 [Apodospora peruviana]|uniref:RRM domain-containing protein n=1 Tax=Apodospora peruviana TaxID=516989 RepID=A0AAE0ISP0_9PEZI|nr:hypothetical protein B0H66DRAFT_612306 [Apodospora peruviana]